MSGSNASGSDTQHFQSEANGDGNTDITEKVATISLVPIKLVKPVEATPENRASISRHAGPELQFIGVCKEETGTHKEPHAREASSSKLSTPRQISDPSAAEVQEVAKPEPPRPYALQDKLSKVQRELQQKEEELRVTRDQLEKTRLEAKTKGENEQRLQRKCEELEDTITSLKKSKCLEGRRGGGMFITLGRNHQIQG